MSEWPTCPYAQSHTDISGSIANIAISPSLGLVCAWRCPTACICGCTWTGLFYNTIFFKTRKSVFLKIPSYVWTRPQTYHTIHVSAARIRLWIWSVYLAVVSITCCGEGKQFTATSMITLFSHPARSIFESSPWH